MRLKPLYSLSDDKEMKKVDFYDVSLAIKAEPKWELLSANKGERVIGLK
jgi:hypothetical protein